MIESLGDKVKLHGLPMSPTSNHMLMVIRGRLIKSSAARAYSKACEEWAWKNRSKLAQLKSILKDSTLRVDCTFVFPKSKLITQKNTLKKVDWMNRLKQTMDELAKMIGVDDSYFVSGYCEKVVGETDEAYIDITISVAELNIQTERKSLKSS